MDISEFQDVVKEIAIKNSADKFEQQRIDNHQRAVG
jgi:hypothetical protein